MSLINHFSLPLFLMAEVTFAPLLPAKRGNNIYSATVFTSVSQPPVPFTPTSHPFPKLFSPVSSISIVKYNEIL